MQHDDYRLRIVPVLEGKGEEVEVDAEVRAMCGLVCPAEISYRVFRAKTSIRAELVNAIAIGSKRIPGFLRDVKVLYYTDENNVCVLDKGIDSVELRHLIDIVIK